MATASQPIPDGKEESQVNGSHTVRTSHRASLQSKGSLDRFESFDVTPIIGKEFPSAQLTEWLDAPNSDELLRDLAIIISQRGVVFFRNQTALTNDLQKRLIQRVGELAGKPATSGLHIHPVYNSKLSHGAGDDQISTISSEESKRLYTAKGNLDRNKIGKAGWHSDITFEPVPSDYAILRMIELPATGGDTLWASGYEVYDRISPAYRTFLETLTATFSQPIFGQSASQNNFQLYSEPRGAPENIGTNLTATHPVIRTNPVTGWKSVYAVGHHVQHINDLTQAESAHLIDWFLRLITENHDLQVRFKWQNPGDVAIWDNRSVYHTATNDYDGQGPRKGQRAVSLGERPYFDPQSTTRREALENEVNGNRAENGHVGGH